MPKLWEDHAFPVGSRLGFRFGPLELHLERSKDEAKLTLVRHPSGSEVLFLDKIEDAPSSGQVERYALDASCRFIHAHPIFPDRSIVVRPENPLRIPPGQSALFFVSLPLWLRLEVILTSGQRSALGAWPALVLSNTWFGDPMEGELCYAQKSTARRNLNAIEKRDWRALCPIEVRNQASGVLDIQRICIQVKHLGLFEGTSHLWTHAVTALHEGADQPMQFLYSDEPPGHESNLKLLTPPKEEQRKSLLLRSWTTFRRQAFSLF